MKLHIHSSRPWAGLLLAALWGQAVLAADPAPAAPGKTPSPATPAPTNIVQEIPKSIFVTSSTTQLVRDPFFPNSTRLAAVTPTTRTNVSRGLVADLSLKAIFGTPDRPLVTINNATFGAGEEQEVVTPTGRVRTRCIEIRLKDETVVIEVGGERRELRFPRRK